MINSSKATQKPPSECPSCRHLRGEEAKSAASDIIGKKHKTRCKMKLSRPYPQIIISKKGSDWLQSGHPWVYEGEILSQDGCEADQENAGVANGDLVDVLNEKGSYLGTGLLSRESKIRVRLLSRNANDRFDRGFWKRRFAYAWNYRKQVMAASDLNAVRIIFGESDQLPGLTVDRFGNILVAQCLSFGMEKRKSLLYPLLLEVLREDGQDVLGIYERNDDELRDKEGLPQGQGWFSTGAEAEAFPSPLTQISENGIRYWVDVAKGQKTGFFLDQKLNRRRAADLARGLDVLDCFTHTGAFALNAVKGEARRVTALDISESAIALARKNAELNGFQDRMDFVTANAFDFLEAKAAGRQRPWNFIILDPPAFTKSRRTVGNAGNGYRRINELALRLLPRGGYLATCTCSHFMPADRFLREVNEGAHAAGVQLRQLEFRQQAPDHPILIDVPETAYLKFFLFQAV